jgi:hypothetical protein
LFGAFLEEEEGKGEEKRVALMVTVAKKERAVILYQFSDFTKKR